MSQDAAAADPLHVDFIARADLPAVGRLGLTRAPGGNEPTAASTVERSLRADLERLAKACGVRTLVSLLGDSEQQLLRISDPAVEAQSLGIEVIRFAIADMGVPLPSAAADFVRLVSGISARLQEGNTVVVHCRAGKGRSGLVAAAVLVAAGHEPGHAISRVRQARPGAVETAMQERYVQEFARLLQG